MATVVASQKARQRPPVARRRIGMIPSGWVRGAHTTPPTRTHTHTATTTTPPPPPPPRQTLAPTAMLFGSPRLSTRKSRHQQRSRCRRRRQRSRRQQTGRPQELHRRGRRRARASGLRRCPMEETAPLPNAKKCRGPSLLRPKARRNMRSGPGRAHVLRCLSRRRQARQSQSMTCRTVSSASKASGRKT